MSTGTLLLISAGRSLETLEQVNRYPRSIKTTFLPYAGNVGVSRLDLFIGY